MKRKFIVIKMKKIFSILLFFLILMVLFISSKLNFDTIKKTTELFIYNVFPSLFLFALFTEFILNTQIINTISNKLGIILNKIFPISKHSSIVILIGFLCGFPNGAKTIISLLDENKITKKQANFLLFFNNNCNPIFIFSTIGISFFNNNSIGYLLLICHFLSSVLIGICASIIYIHNIIHEKTDFLNTFEQKTYFKDKKIPIFENLKLSMKKSFMTLLNIFGFMIIFSIVSENISLLLNNFIKNQDLIKIIISPFEITTGIFNILNIDKTLEFKLILTSFLLGFSGICIIAQIYSVINSKHFSLNLLIISKIIHGVLSSIICFILLKLNIFNIYNVLETFSNINLFNYTPSNNYIIFFYMIISMLFFVLFIKNSLNNKKR